jgi:arsenite methyltransferase
MSEEIKLRYNILADDDSCCLSCGHAIDFSNSAEGEVCVDLGCGRGIDAVSLAAKVGQNGFVHGIDLSENMILKAQSTARKLDVKNIKFHKALLENLPLVSESADLVISNCTINHASNKILVWAEIKRILKKGGRFVISDIYSLAEVPEEYKNDSQAVAECWAGAVTRSEFMDLIYNSGFKNIEIIEESKPYEKGKIMVASMTVRGIKSCGCI